MRVPVQMLAVARCAAKEEVRYAIDGVAIQRDDDGTSHAVATDGRALIAATWTDKDAPHGAAFSTLIVADTAKGQSRKYTSARRFNRSTRRYESGEDARNFADVSETGGKLTRKTKRGKVTHEDDSGLAERLFPKWKQVLPNYQDGDCVAVALDPLLLARVLTTAAQVLGMKTGPVTLRVPKDRNKPVVIQGENASGHSVRAALMPIRTWDADLEPKA